MIRVRSALGCALLAAGGMAGAALAQTGPNPPPRHDTVSPTGVSYYSGAFSHQERDLVIGGAFPAGLTLERSYLSSLDQGLSGSSGIPTQGWTNNLNARVGNTIAAIEGIDVPPGQEAFLYSVMIGTRSVGFQGGSSQPTGGFVGGYAPIERGGESLVFAGAHSTGTFTFTDVDGTTLSFNSQSALHGALAVSVQTAPDGTRLEFSYDRGLRSVISNRGYALLFEYGDVPGGRARTKGCAVNMATTHVTASSSCPAGAQAVTYHYSPNGTFETGPILTGVTDARGQRTSYGYDPRGHLDCITPPGQTACRIANRYGECYAKDDPDTAEVENPPGYRWHEPVLSQSTATGETYSYSFPSVQECPSTLFTPRPPITMTARDGAATTIATTNPGVPSTITDPLGRVTRMDYYVSNVLPGVNSATLVLVTRPEGDQAAYPHEEAYDARGNVIKERLRARPGTGLPDIVRTAGYPASCANPKSCNKPEYVIDAKLQRTDYTYSADHGGVLSETGPAVNGVRPQKRFSYVQRHARVISATGGYVPTASPVWLLDAQSSCRTSAATGNTAAPCALAGDEVRTTYEYGPDSGPNTLLLRGIAVTADGQTRRTCYAYDAFGRKIGETTPGANLTVCP